MTDGLDFHCFGNLLLGCSQHRLTADFRLEQRVHQSRLSQAALSCKQKTNKKMTGNEKKKHFDSDCLHSGEPTVYTMVP